jgi:PAS domain S-box-containing protein
MRLRTQFLITLFVFASVVAIIVFSVAATHLRLGELRQHQDIASEAKIRASTLGYISINYFLYQHNLSDWRTMVSVFYDDLCRLNSTDQEQQKLVETVLLDLINANETFNDAVTKLQHTPLNRTSGIPMFEELWNQMATQTQQLTLNAERLSNWLDLQSNEVNLANLTLIIILIGLFGAYFFFIYGLFFRRTLSAITNLRAKTKTISQGNLNYPANGRPRRDEIGELASDVDTMVENLKRTTASKEELEKEVAERKKAEQALLEAKGKLQEYATNLEKIVEERTKKILESEQSYRELYESFGEAFVAMDWELTVIHWNKAAERVTRIKAENALGKKMYDVLPEMMSIDFTPYYESLRKKQPARFMMNTVSRETGKDAIFEISTYPSTQGIIIIIEDKTEEEQTKRLSAIGQTAGMVGHDIRNPLQAITSDLYLIKAELNEIPQCRQLQGVQESLATIEDNIFYINKIVSDLQDYTRPLSPVYHEVNINTLLSSVVGNNFPKNIETTVSVQENLVVKTDAAYLKRILSNLVNNAVQAMPNGGKLDIQAAQKENTLLISIKDTGVGIPDEVRDKIFTPLFTTKPKGQGLGLAVVKRLVTGLKGNVSYVSQEGRGTEFIIELPISP